MHKLLKIFMPTNHFHLTISLWKQVPVCICKRIKGKKFCVRACVCVL